MSPKKNARRGQNWFQLGGGGGGGQALVSMHREPDIFQ